MCVVGENMKVVPDIYFYMYGGNRDEKWYAIKSCSSSSIDSFDSYSRRRLERALPPIPDLERALPPIPDSITSSQFVAFGSKIYASGGLDRSKPIIRPGYSYNLYPSSNKVFSIDTLHPEEGWKTENPMNTARLEHYMLADAGKIYVLGGLNLMHQPDPTDGKRIFAEVYDPLNSNAGWKPLARVRDCEIDLPQTIYGHAVVEDNKKTKILFHAHFYRSMFYLSTRQQDDVGIYDDKFGLHHPISAFLDGVFYFLSFNRISAYDISTNSRKHQRVVLRDVRTNTLPCRDDFDEAMPIGFLLSLGNSCLALIWAKEPDYEKFVNVHCSIIEMSKEGDSFAGQVLNCSTYSVQRGVLRACMAV